MPQVSRRSSVYGTNSTRAYRVKCLRTTRNLKNWRVERGLNRTAFIPSRPGHSRRQLHTTTLTRTERLETAAPKLIFFRGILYHVSTFKGSWMRSAPSSKSPAITRTRSMATTSSSPLMSNDNAAQLPLSIFRRRQSDPDPVCLPPRAQRSRPTSPSQAGVALPNHPFRVLADDTSCSICFDPLFPSLNDNDHQSKHNYIRVITQCGHAFHAHCLQTWICHRWRHTHGDPYWRSDQQQQPPPLWQQERQPRCPLCQRSLWAQHSDEDAEEPSEASVGMRDLEVGVMQAGEVRGGAWSALLLRKPQRAAARGIGR